MIKNIMVALLIVTLSSNIWAANQYLDLTLNEVSFGWAGEGVFVKVNEDITIADGCVKPTFFLSKDTLLFSENYSMLLAALCWDRHSF